MQIVLRHWKHSIFHIYFYYYCSLELASVQAKCSISFISFRFDFSLKLWIIFAIGNAMIFESCMSNDFKIRCRIVYLAIVCRPTDGARYAKLQIAYEHFEFRTYFYMQNIVCAQSTTFYFISGVESNWIEPSWAIWVQYAILLLWPSVLYMCINVPCTMCTYHIMIINKATLLSTKNS